MTDEPRTSEDSEQQAAGSGAPHQAPSGLASLASENFSVLDSIGGVRGVVESLLPELAFLVMFVVTHDLTLTIVASLVLCAVEFVARLVQRQTVAGALSGTVMVLICLFAAYKSNDARNYYLPACIINAAWALAFGISLAARRPGVGFFVELVANPPMEGWGAWLWVGMFVLRDAVQVPLWLAGNVYVLGTATLVLGIPLFALVCWASYLIIAGPRREHKARAQAAAQAQAQEAACSDASGHMGAARSPAGASGDVFRFGTRWLASFASVRPEEPRRTARRQQEAAKRAGKRFGQTGSGTSDTPGCGQHGFVSFPV